MLSDQEALSLHQAFQLRVKSSYFQNVITSAQQGFHLTEVLGATNQFTGGRPIKLTYNRLGLTNVSVEFSL